MDRPNFREFFRIVYPWDERPRFVLRSQICEVLDCSERGLRFRVESPGALAVGSEISGRLRLNRGPEVVVAGVVVRVGDGEIALSLQEPGVSFHLILKEQIRLRKAREEESGSDAGSGGGTPQ